MLDNIYLRFKHDWPGFWVRLSVSAALCDGPVNESEQKALLQFCNRICDLYGVDDAARLWNAFANSPEDPEHLKNRKPQQEAKVLLIVLREIYRLLYADGVSNEKEFTWVDRFSMATGLVPSW